jgi:hypothetical protein
MKNWTSSSDAPEAAHDLAAELSFPLPREEHNRSRTFLSACKRSGQGDSSVGAAVDPAPVHRRVLYTFAHVPLNAGRLVTLQVSTALQEQQRRSHERGFDDGEHARDPLLHKLPKLPLRQARRRGRRHPPCPRKMDEDDPQKAGENVAH